MYRELESKVNDMVSEYIETMEVTKANQLGLDPRAGAVLFLNDDGIAVYVGNDKALRYYGGFEYINDMDRTQLGDYVFYSNRATRVDECLEFYMSENQYHG